MLKYPPEDFDDLFADDSPQSEAETDALENAKRIIAKQNRAIQNLHQAGHQLWLSEQRYKRFLIMACYIAGCALSAASINLYNLDFFSFLYIPIGGIVYGLLLALFAYAASAGYEAPLHHWGNILILVVIPILVFIIFQKSS